MNVVDYFMAYNFKIWWVGAYRGMGGHWNEYDNGKFSIFAKLNAHKKVTISKKKFPQN